MSWPTAGRSRTIAIESEDAAAVIAAVASVGLGDYVNTSYPRGLADLIDGTPAAIRGHRRGHELGQVPHRRARSRTAAGPRWSTEPRSRDWARASTEIGRHRSRAARADRRPPSPPWSPRHGRTTSARSPQWAPPACASPRTRRTSSPPSRTAPGSAWKSSPATKRPAWPTSRCRPSWGWQTQPIVVFDTGGGSSQFTFGHGSMVDDRFSVNVGAVKYTEQFGLDGAGRSRGSRPGPGGHRRRPGTPRRPSSPRLHWSGWAARSRTSPP